MAYTGNRSFDYEKDGFTGPIEVFSEYDAALHRRRLEAVEARASGHADRLAAFRNDGNWVIPLLDSLARNPDILDAVETVIGHNILALHVDVFIKEPRSDEYISWHQDLHYWGLDSVNEVTAWLALSPATANSGCMRFLPGSHAQVFDHHDTFAANNMLTRGQEVTVDEDEAMIVHAELQPGQMSLHHGRLLHASGPNQSCDRRIGIAIRYISPETQMARPGARVGASLVRGEDRYGHFDLVKAPTEEFGENAMRNWRRLRAIQESILYAGVERIAS